MTYKKIHKDIHAKAIKTGWVLPLILGSVSEEDMTEFMIDLCEKIICNSKGDSLTWDDIPLEDFGKIQDYIMKEVKGSMSKKN
jgi:hypothetical protein